MSVCLPLSLSFSLFPVLGTGTRTGLGIEGAVGRGLRIEASGPRQSQTQVKQRSKKKSLAGSAGPGNPFPGRVVCRVRVESGRVEFGFRRVELGLCCTYSIVLCRTVQLVTVSQSVSQLVCLSVCLYACPVVVGVCFRVCVCVYV